MDQPGCCKPQSSSEQTEPGCCPPQESSKPVSSCCSPAELPASQPCCPPAAEGSCCPVPNVSDDQPGYKLWPFVTGWLETVIGRVPRVESRLSWDDHREHWQMRWGIGRMRYSLAAGLYAVGEPDGNSEVLVTANYKMSFDLLRSSLAGRDLWLLVLDTRGINVWCAAGKGTFGTLELVQRIAATRLTELVEHRRLILPQLSAPGVAAHEVKKQSGFQVVYGPVRCEDLPRFFDNGLKSSVEMRRVSFPLRERLVLTPVELVNARKQVLWGIPVLLLLGGVSPSVFSFSAAWTRGGGGVLAGLVALLCGALLSPLLLPWLPGRAFAVKGALTGFGVALFGLVVFYQSFNWLNGMALLAALPAVSSWYAMHFTGSTPFTSPSGVEKEMRMAIPAQAAALVVGLACWIAAAFV